MKIHRSIKVSGKVQGVFFRQTAKEKALEYTIYGFARNDANGTVFVEAEGEEDQVNKFIEWCKKGSDRAIVSHIEINDGVFKNFTSFTILKSNTF